MVLDSRASMPLQSLKRRLLAKKRPSIDDKTNAMNNTSRTSRVMADSQHRTPRSSSLGPYNRVTPSTDDHTPSLPPLPKSRASPLPGHVTERNHENSSPRTRKGLRELGQSLSCPDLIDEKHARYASRTRSKGSPASMASAPHQILPTARSVRNTPISMTSSPVASPLIRHKQGFVSPRKNSQPLSHKQSNNSLTGLFSRKSSQITDASLLSSNKSHPIVKPGRLSFRPEVPEAESQVPLTWRSINAVTGDQPTSVRNSQILHNHTTIHIKVDNDNVAHVVDVEGGPVETINEEEPETGVPDGMSRATFDRCCQWVEQVNLACKNNRSVDDCAMVPINWSESVQGTDRT